jgi:hypothetical protein
MTQIKAPWTAEQVAALNRWQNCVYVHPFTCGSAIQAQEHRDGAAVLMATSDGWICPYCDYRQDWAHDFMFDDPPDHAIPSFD